MVNSTNFQNANVSPLATEATLQAAKVVLDAIKATLDIIDGNTDKLLSFTFDGDLLQVSDPFIDVQLSSRASETTLAAINSKLPAALTAGGRFKVAIEESIALGRNWTITETVPISHANLDASLSSRATEATLAAIKAQTDKLTFDTTFLNVSDPFFDVLLSTRASEATLATRATEATLAAIKAKTDLLTFSAGLLQVDDPALDVLLSSRLAESTFTGRIGEVSATPTANTVLERLKQLQDKITQMQFSAGLLQVDDPNMDVILSSRASETTLAAIKAQTDLLSFNAGHLLVDDPNLDVTLSSRASEATLAAMSAKLPAALVSGRLDVNLGAISTTTQIRSRIDNVAGTAQTGRNWSDDFAKLQNIDVLLSSIASETTLAARASEATVAKLIASDKGSRHNHAVIANTDILAAAATPTNAPCLFRIFASFAAAGVLKATITNGGNTQTIELNEGRNLKADKAYIFDIVVVSGDSVQIQYSVTTTAKKLIVMEVQD